MRRISGFSLMELMVALLIVLILATIAVPSYQYAMRKRYRLEATALLMDLHLRQAQWRSAHSSYADSLEVLRAPTQGGALLNYQLTLGNVSATAYRLRVEARPGKAMVNDRVEGVDCSALEIDQAGTRTPARCWR